MCRGDGIEKNLSSKGWLLNVWLISTSGRRGKLKSLIGSGGHRLQNAEANGVTGSMSRPGCPYDNAVAEHFFSAAKRECIYRMDFSDITEVRRILFDYIEVFYNRTRAQACLGHISPINYAAGAVTQKAA
jgi:transposase InsO family protein